MPCSICLPSALKPLPGREDSNRIPETQLFSFEWAPSRCARARDGVVEIEEAMVLVALGNSNSTLHDIQLDVGEFSAL